MNEGLNLNVSRSLFDYQPETVNNKSVLISGGTTGIGRATAVLLVAQGAEVVIFGRHEKELNETMNVATKSGIEGFSEALRKEGNPLGIKVMLIEPGAVGTDMQDQYSPEEQRQKEEKMEMRKAEDIAARILYSITQPRRCDVVMRQVRPHPQGI
jgi:NADP-dependent 3-hydroxy acid dehydrogenase YdfG